MKISASEQVQHWLTALPAPRKRRVRAALRSLARGHGDINGLLEPLEGFNRLRIGGMRIVFRQGSRDQILWECANIRDVVYELFQQLLEARKQAGSP